MRDIVKYPTVSRLEIQHSVAGKYLLGLIEPGTWPEAESTLTAEDMVRFGLDPGEGLVGTTLELSLTAVPFSRETCSLDTVLITRLWRTTEVRQHYARIPPDKSERRTCRLEAKTPVPGGTLVLLPPTYYELDLPLTEGEYRRLRGLPAGTALEVQLRHLRQRLRDVVLTYRGMLDDSRVFPQDYAGCMIPLARAMIAYFNGDVDVVGHYCGLEIEEEREQPEADSRLGTRTWRREYFAVDALSPDDWEAAFADSVARIDTILTERYDNRLPVDTVREFYDNLETSAWESKRPHLVEELSVGLLTKYVFREHCHLPSIVIEARSVVGNRKACHAACEALSQEAAALFGARFDHISLEIEEIGQTESPGEAKLTGSVPGDRAEADDPSSS
ncbi:MAG: hypothetical protein WBW48_01480 [Anaerolineae bacterium]